jgi:hypothetical protein
LNGQSPPDDGKIRMKIGLRLNFCLRRNSYIGAGNLIGGRIMTWIGWLVVAAVAFIGIKLFVKTMKFIFVLAVIAALFGAFLLWQNGMFPLK